MTRMKITLTSNVLIEGKPTKAGATVEVDRPVALDLLARKRAVEVAPVAPVALAAEVEKTKEAKKDDVNKK